MKRWGYVLIIFFLLSLFATSAYSDISIVEEPPEPLDLTVSINFNVTNLTGNVSEVILTIDGNTSNSIILEHRGNDMWGIDLDTTDLENGAHTFLITATTDISTAESMSFNYNVENDIRIIFIDVPETISGFYHMKAEVFDARIDTTNNWYMVDFGTAVILPLDVGNTFQSIIDVSNISDGPHEFTVKAINSDNIVRMKTVSINVLNSEAGLSIIPPSDHNENGQNGTYHLRVLAGGMPVNANNVWYGVDNVVWDNVQYVSGFEYEAIVPTSNLSEGPHQLFVRVLDDNGQIISQMEVEVFGPDTSFPWLLIFAIIVIVAISTSLMVRILSKKQIIPPSDVFLIYENGLLIKHLAQNDIDPGSTDEEITDTLKVDKDLVTSMLIAIQDFVKASFSQSDESTGSDLKHIGFGDRTILMEKNGHIFLTMVVSAKPKDLDLGKYDIIMRNMADEIVVSFGTPLKNWDGDMDSFEGMDEQLSGIFEI